MSKNRKEDVLIALRGDIARGLYPAGSHLRIKPLSKRYEVSEMPVREALCVLEVEGIIENRPHHGSFIRQFTPQEILDIYKTRAVLEESALNEAFPALTTGYIRKLQQLVDQWDNARNTMQIINQHTKFHIMIYERANRPQLLHQIDVLRNQVAHYLYAYLTEGNSPGTKAEHQAIVDTITAGDKSQLTSQIFDHVLQSGKALANYVEQNPATGKK